MSNTQRPKIGLFMNARDENNLKEWVAHHLLLGFDKIIIFDHKSVVPIKSLFLPSQNKVEIIECTLDKKIKILLMNEATKIATEKGIDWFIYLDADEFIILNHKNKIHPFIDLYKDFDSIGMNWIMFGSNNHETPPSGLIIDNFTKIDKINLDKHVKSFVKTSQVNTCNNPHFYLMKNTNKMIGIDYKPMVDPYCFHECSLNIHNAPAYIAHYAIQSKETYIKRKINRESDDSGNFRNNLNEKIVKVHRFFNNCENLIPKQKYSNNINDFLKNNNIFIH